MSGGIENGHLYAIAAMAVVTALLRVGGYWLIGLVPITPRLRRGLEALPIAIFAASIAPLAVQGGPAGWIAAPVVALLMLATGREIVALLAGLAVAAAVRALGF
ncbi:MAG TPA: AzlD domain-containing protein [Beijerinckiaceae bacterium]|jgi:uncharacterized membrane protein